MKWNATPIFSSSSSRYNRASEDKPVATIVSSVGTSIYKIRDPLGRLSNVFSPSSYNTGDVVRVMSRQIVGKTARVSKIMSFEV